MTPRLVALLLLLLPSLALGAAVIDPSGTPLSEDVAAAAAAQAGQDEGHPLSLPVPEGAWLVVGGTLGPERAGSVTALSEQLDRAQALMARLETVKALALLRQAVGSLPSTSSPVGADELSGALELLGQAAQDEGQVEVAKAAYLQLLAARPSYQLTTPPGTGYEDVFDAARREANQEGHSVLAIRHARSEVRWDGQRIEPKWSGSMPVGGGRHLLQWSDGLGWQGAWVDVPPGQGTVAILATDGSIESLLAEGAADEGHRAALVSWLGSLGEDAVVVVQHRDPLSGYLVEAGRVQTWSAPAPDLASSAGPQDRLRVTVGGGYGAVDGSSYLEALAALEVRIKGPLFVHIDGGFGVSQPIDLGPSHPLTGHVALLPGVGVGAVVRMPGRRFQPWVGLSLGVWIVPRETRTAAEITAGLMDDDLATRLVARTPVGFRGYLDGGVDLLPSKRWVVRVLAGIGYGYGLQVRAGLQVGLRLGVMP